MTEKYNNQPLPHTLQRRSAKALRCQEPLFNYLTSKPIQQFTMVIQQFVYLLAAIPLYICARKYLQCFKMHN